jgi:hypothetical protein
VFRRILPLVGIIAGFALVSSSPATQGGNACQLGSGQVTKTGAILVQGTSQTTFKYSSALSCNGSEPETGGTLSAGMPVTIGGVAYQAPDIPYYGGSCLAPSVNSGTFLIQWNNGKVSALALRTNDGVLLPGTFNDGSMTLTSVGVDALGHHTTLSVPLAYGNDPVGGVFSMTPDANCVTANTGSDYPVTGFIGHGNQS